MNTNLSTISLKNYINQHIYTIVSVRHPNITPEEKRLKLQSIFKELINNIRVLTTTHELDVYNTPMGILFQHLKLDIIKIVANCLPKVDKLFIEKGIIYNLEWNIRLFKALHYLKAKDIIIWFFLQIPYYTSVNNNLTFSNTTLYSQQIIKLRDYYKSMLEWLYTHYPEELYLTEVEFVYLSNQTCMPYALSYHDKNNVELLTLYSKLIRKICPWVNYFSPRIAEIILKQNNNNNNQYTTTTPPILTILTTPTTPTTPPIPPISQKKLKICFISDSFTTDTSVLRDRISVIGKLDRTKYEVYFASFYKFEVIKGIIAKLFMTKIKENYIYLGNSLTSAREKLEKYELDFIVYPEIGMKLLPTLLAYSRIAPIQLTTWGHSETSGIDTIDYFISSEYFCGLLSCEEVQKQYSEKLILLKSLGTFYISPHKLFIGYNDDYKEENQTQNQTTNQTTNKDKDKHKPKKVKKFKTREELGFTSKDRLYVCLQTFYKLNPEFEKCLARILELDPNGIVLLSNTFPYCKNHLERIRNTLGLEKIKRIKWYGSLEKDEFLNVVSVSDVCLDPFPFGGCNTSFDAFDYNIPVITLPSEFLHGQFTNGLYKKMSKVEDDKQTNYTNMFEECCAVSPEEYAQKASSIGINEKLRHKINRNIEMRKHLIFQEQESIEDWNSLFEKIIKKNNINV